MTTNEAINHDQLAQAAEGDYSTAAWPIGGVCRLESRDGDWALVTQWGTAYLLKRQGLVQMIDACEAALDSDLGLESIADSLTDLADLWEAVNTEVSTRQGCAKSLGERLDALMIRVEALEQLGSMPTP